MLTTHHGDLWTSEVEYVRNFWMENPFFLTPWLRFCFLYFSVVILFLLLLPRLLCTSAVHSHRPMLRAPH